MVDEHKHEHDHEHEHADVHEPQPSASKGDNLDAAGRSLSDALRISFAILKVIMVILIVAFLASGFKSVGSDEKALVLRFGKIQGVGQEAILGPGAHWTFPYPIDEVVRIPVEKNINLAINTFWYKETRDDILGPGVKPRNYVPDQLDPVQEGYCLTGSQRNAAPTAAVMQTIAAAGAQQIRQGDGSDYNIVHTKWQVNYQITGVEQFFRNLYVHEALPGEIYFDVMNQSISPLLRSLVEDAVVKAMVHYTIDEALQSIDTIPQTRPAVRAAEARCDRQRHPRGAGAVGERQVAQAGGRVVRGVHQGQPDQRTERSRRPAPTPRPRSTRWPARRRRPCTGPCWIRMPANRSGRRCGRKPPGMCRTPSRRPRPTR